MKYPWHKLSTFRVLSKNNQFMKSVCETDDFSFGLSNFIALNSMDIEWRICIKIIQFSNEQHAMILKYNTFTQFIKKRKMYCVCLSRSWNENTSQVSERKTCYQSTTNKQHWNRYDLPVSVSDFGRCSRGMYSRPI